MAFVESIFRGQVMTETVDSTTLQGAPDFPQRLGHPKPLWMLFMTEFWERFAFYSVSWALALYIVQQFYHGDPAGFKGFADFAVIGAIGMLLCWLATFVLL